MHAASTVNGELRARTGQGLARLYQGVQNVPITYLVCLRERGAAYFVGSVPGAAGMAALPALRPVAIDHAGDDQILFGGLTQAVHGEVGHTIASRVSLVAAEVVPDLAACSLRGRPPRGPTTTSPADSSGRWSTVRSTATPQGRPRHPRWRPHGRRLVSQRRPTSQPAR